MPSAVSDLKTRMLELSAPDAHGVLRDGATKRAARTALAMDALAQLWNEAAQAVPFDVPSRGVALAAVGSLARGQIGPASDLDLVLISDGHTLGHEQLAELANKLWYPIWDAGIDLDYSVRTVAECEAVTDHDLPAAMGWLDVRAVAGDGELVMRTSTAILERWRKAARKRLPELLDSAHVRLKRFGQMPYVNQPDIKESRGGLRDTVLLGALAASWLADRPHGRYDASVERLLDVRDCIHMAAGKDTNLLLAPYQAPVAAMLGLADPTLPSGAREAKSIDDLQTLLARLGFSLDATAARAERTLVHDKPRFSFFQIRHPRAGGKREAPTFDVLAAGVAEHEHEVVLAPGADVQADGALPLRAAVAAAEHGLSINTSTLLNLRRAPIRYTEWTDETRALFVRLLATGDQLTRTWEELDVVGLPSRWMPEWEAIRNRPSASAAHRFTIDRHMLEVTAQLTYTRPDFLAAGVAPRTAEHYTSDQYTALLLAGILHDIGKRPGVTDHAREGARHARAVLTRMGFDPQIVHWATLLVREHLTLSQFASSRNPNDPEAGGELARRVEHDPVLLDMLFDLTRADMCSLGATAEEQISGKVGWSRWRAQLVTTMASVAQYHM